MKIEFSTSDIVKGFERWIENYRADPEGFNAFAVDDENTTSTELALDYADYLVGLIIDEYVEE